MPTDPYGYPSETPEAYAEEAYWKEQDRNLHGGEGVKLIQPPRLEKNIVSTTHTRGVLEVVTANGYAIGVGIRISAVSIWSGFKMVANTITDSHTEGDQEEITANARLLAAAYNSYDKHCGDRAVECAEGDLLGEALEALRKLRDAVAKEPVMNHNRYDGLGIMVNSVLAKATPTPVPVAEDRQEKRDA